MREGYGTLLTPLGKYCGEFVCDTKQGMGTLILNDASSYYGLFMNNLFHGKGTLCNKDGTVYVGEWEEGMKSGDGYETLPDGRYVSAQHSDLFSILHLLILQKNCQYTPFLISHYVFSLFSF